LLSKADSAVDASEKRQHLREAATLGCNIFERLAHDAEFFDDFADITSARARDPRAFRGIVRDPYTFEILLESERAVLIKGCLPEHLAASVIDQCKYTLSQVAHQQVSTEDAVRSLYAAIKDLRDSACKLANDLVQTERSDRELHKDRRKLKLID